MSDEGAGSKDTGQSWADRAGFPDRRLQKLQGCTCRALRSQISVVS